MIWLLGYGMAFAGLRLSRVDFRHISCLLLFVICIMYRDRDSGRARVGVEVGAGVKLLLFFCFLSLGSSYSALLSVEIFVAAALSVSIAKPFRLSSNLWPFCVLWLFVCSFFCFFQKPHIPPSPHSLLTTTRQFTFCDLWHIRAQCATTCINVFWFTTRRRSVLRAWPTYQATSLPAAFTPPC